MLIESMATPHVAGVAALVWSYDPTLTNAQIRVALQQSAEDLGSTGRDQQTGYGLVRALAAVELLGLNVVEPQCAADADCAGGLCCNGSCVVAACGSDADCGDGNECTVNTCLNPGACNALCETSNAPENTVCGAGGICCGGACSTPACDVDTDCDDSVACTVDTCFAPTTCAAACDSAPTDTCEPICEPSPLSCTDGIDNDCDGAVDEDDECVNECTAQLGDACELDAECCSGKCRGKRGAKSCK